MRIRQDRAGVALVMVVVVVAMLVVVAVPFAMSMRLAYRGSATYVDQVEARFAARGALRHATGRLMRTHDSRETTGLDKDYNTPDFDGRYEIADAVEPRGIGPGRRVLWSARVEDEQGKVDLNSASPLVLGNLLASCTVTEGVDAGLTEIPVDSATAGFFDPRGGYLWYANELIRYKSFDGAVFSGCERGVAADAPGYADPGKIPEGALVIDARAYWLARLAIMRGEASGRLFLLRTVAELAELAEVAISLGPSYPPISAALAPHELERLAPYVTVHAHRSAGEGLVKEQWVLSDIPVPTDDDTDPARIDCIHPEDYPVGSTVRIANDGGAEYALVAATAVNPKSSRGVVFLDKQLTREYTAQAATIALIEAHPVNLNTASYKVLVALLAGLGRVDQKVWANKQAGGGPITKAEAEAMARAIVQWRAEKGAVRNEGDLVTCWGALTGGDLEPRKVGTALANLAYGGMGLGARTMPGVYASGNVFAIEGTGIVQGPTGHEVARAVVKEIVEVAPPMASQHRVRGQVGFERAMRRYSGVGVETFPAWVRSGPMRDISFGYLGPTNDLVPGQVLDADQAGDLRLRHVPVMLTQINGGTNAVEHFDGTREGQSLSGPIPIQALGKQPQLPNGHIECGAVAFWVRYDGGDGLRHYLADYGQAEWENRISLYVDTQADELVAELADASLERVKAQVRVAWQPKNGVWYHVAVVWKSTNDGQLGLLVDGRPTGAFTYRDDQNLDRATHLANALGPADGTIAVANTEGFPDEGSLRIGAEIVEYESKSKTGFTVRTAWPGFSGAAEGRGARGTAAADHPQDARVVPWGFSGGFIQGMDAFVGGALLASDLAADAWTRVDIVNNPVPANPAPFPPKFFLDTHTSVEVTSTVGFANKGYVVFGSPGQNGNWRTEIVYYDGKTGTSLTGLIRAQLGTTALGFPNLATFVIPISIHVTQHTEYGGNNQWIAIDDEWIQATDKVMQGAESFFVFRGRFRQIFTDLLLTGQLDHPQRSVGGTNTAAHVTGSKVLPVLQFTGVKAGAILAHPLARRDHVTLMNRNQVGERELRTVRWHSHTNGPNGDPDGGVCRVSFDDFTQRRYNSGHPLTRLLKFPAGELPNVLLAFHVGGKSPGSEQAGGQVVGLIDELFAETYGPPGAFFATAPVAPGADTISVTGIDSLSAFGVVKLGDEFIGFASKNPTQNGEGELLGCTRGLMGTPVSAHDAGTPVFNASHYLRAVLFPADVPEDAAVISAQGADRLPDYGAILAGGEVIGFTARTGGGIEMPVDGLGKGTLRGRYGTRREEHAENTLGVWQPVRYADHYALQVDTPELTRLEDRFALRTTGFGAVAWEVDSPNDDLEVHVLVRLDGVGSWADEPLVDQPAPAPGRILLFTDPEKLGSLGPQVADRIELRFLYYYGKGAFKSDAWKATPRLRSYTLHYASGPDTLLHEAGR